MGYGDLLDEVRAHSEKYNNIHYQPAVTPEEIPLYTSSADVGFNIAEPSCVNHLYSLPNKIFEYIGCGVSIIVSDFPDMGKLVDDHDCGWKVSVDKTSISKLIESIDINNAKKKKENTRTCGEHFDWNKEALILKPIYAEDYPSCAKRPKYSILSKKKILLDYDLKINHWRDSLRICLKNL